MPLDGILSTDLQLEFQFSQNELFAIEMNGLYAAFDKMDVLG